MSEVIEEVKTGRKAKPAKVKIKILAQDGETGDVFLAVNGNALQIKRGEAVEVDPMYLEVLNNSVITTVITDFDASGAKTSKAIEIQRFPYQILG